MKNNSVFYPITCLCMLACHTIFSIDNPHFYRANFLWDEPRFEKAWLSTMNMHIAGGSAKHAFNNQGQKVPLLSIFGPQNMQPLGKTPGLDPSQPLDKILIDLAALPQHNDFAKLKFTGKFETVEVILNAYQNFLLGFFMQVYLPIRHLKITRTQFYEDLSPETSFPNKNTPQWIQFLNNFDAILEKFNMAKGNVNQNGIGDLSILVGWACNYEQTKKIDFIDVDTKIGILMPTGKKRSLTNVFSLPTGYDGFWAIPFKFDCALGYWEWLTLGLHIGALFFLEHKHSIRMQAADNASSYFMLLTGQAKVDPGTIWEISSYAKADHICKGLSLLFGYCYTQKEKDCITPDNTTVFNPIVVNQNPLLKGWDMHVLHFAAEWDFTTKPIGAGYRLGFFYNYVIKGRRIFDTAIKDAFLGIDIAYCY